MLLYVGYPPAENVNRNAEYWAFGPGLKLGQNHVSEGLAALDGVAIPQFVQRTGEGLLSKALWLASPFFDYVLVPVGFVGLIGVGVLGLWRRDLSMTSVAVVPLAYLLAHAVMLASENRYAFPAQPMAVATSCALATSALAEGFSLLRRSARSKTVHRTTDPNP